MHLSVWTVNEIRDMEKLMEMGVMDIITDYPDKALDLAEKKGYTIYR